MWYVHVYDNVHGVCAYVLHVDDYVSLNMKEKRFYTSSYHSCIGAWDLDSLDTNIHTSGLQRCKNKMQLFVPVRAIYNTLFNAKISANKHIRV